MTDVGSREYSIGWLTSVQREQESVSSAHITSKGCRFQMSPIPSRGKAALVTWAGLTHLRWPQKSWCSGMGAAPASAPCAHGPSLSLTGPFQVPSAPGEIWRRSGEGPSSSSCSCRTAVTTEAGISALPASCISLYRNTVLPSSDDCTNKQPPCGRGVKATDIS